MVPINFTHHFALPLDEYIRLTFSPDENEKHDLGKLPNVTVREEVKRHEDDKVVYTVVRYCANGFIPPAARQYIKPHMLSWLEHATFNKAGKFWEWHVEPYHFKEYITCTGRMSLHADGARTKRVTRGRLEIKIPVIGQLGEKIILGHLEKNFAAECRMWHETLRKLQCKKSCK